MRKLLALVLVLVVVTLAYAGSYTVTTTAAQDSKITRMRIYANTNSKLGAPFANDNAFVDFQCKQRLADLYRNLQTEPDIVFEDAWDAAPQATRDTICTTLGLPVGCKP